MEAFVCKVCHKLVENHEDEAVLCLCLGSAVLGKERYCKKMRSFGSKSIKNYLIHAC